MRHWFFLVLAIWFAAFGAYLAFVPRAAKNSFEAVPEKERPAWSYMPLWYYKTLGFASLAVSVLFAYLFGSGR